MQQTDGSHTRWTRGPSTIRLALQSPGHLWAIHHMRRAPGRLWGRLWTTTRRRWGCVKTRRRRYMSCTRHENGTITSNLMWSTCGWLVVWEGTHDECLQVHPIITDQEPYITGKAETACGAAGSHRGVSMGVYLEDGVRGDCKHRCVRSKSHCQLTIYRE